MSSPLRTFVFAFAFTIPKRSCSRSIFLFHTVVSSYHVGWFTTDFVVLLTAYRKNSVGMTSSPIKDFFVFNFLLDCFICAATVLCVGYDISPPGSRTLALPTTLRFVIATGTALPSR